jgi:ABC-type nitrate/sulfonate/bicarbonate transport system substrate-binding protein
MNPASTLPRRGRKADVTHTGHSFFLFPVFLFLFGFLYGAQAEPLSTVHIGVPTNSATWFPIYVTWKKGIFRDLGLELLPVTMQARTSLAALASKQVGFITQIGSPLTAIARGLPARVVMVFCERSHHVLVAKPEISSPAQLRGRVVAISQPGGTVHRELLMVLEKFKINPNEIKTVSLGSTPNGVTALKLGNVDAAMLLVPHDLYLEKDGFRPLAYIKDVAEFPLAGFVAHTDRLRERPDEAKKVLLGALKGTAYTKTHRDEVLPLLKEFLGLENLEMAKKAYERLRDIWSDNGIPSEKGLRAAAMLAEVPNTFPLENLVNWSFLNEAAASFKTR